MAQPDNFSLYQPLVVASLWMAARGLRGTGHPGRSFVLAGLFVGLATLARNDGLFVLVVARSRLPVRPLAGLALGRRRRRPTHPVRRGASARSPSSCSSWPRGGRASWPSSARSRRRPPRARSCSSATSGSGTASPRRPPSTTSSGWGSARSSRPGSAARSRRRCIYLTLVCGFVLGPSMIVGGLGAPPLDRLRAVLRLRRDPVRVLGAGLGRPRPGRHVHPLGGRARAVQLHPRARGDRRRRRLGRRPPAGLGPRGRAPGLRWRDDRVRHRRRVPRLARRSTPTWAARARPAAGGRRTRSTRPARPPSDRVMSIDAVGTKYWTGHGGVVLVNDPLDTIHDVATRLRHPLARPRARRRRSARSPRSSTAAPRPAWIGAADHEPGQRRPSWPSTRSCRPRPRWSRRDPARGRRSRRSGSSPSRSSSGSSSPRQIVFPKPEDTAYYVGVARNLVEGRGLVSRRAVELRDAAARLPAPGLRGLAAAADVPRRDPDGDPRRDLRGRPVVVGRRSARSSRSSPGGSPRTSPRNADCRRDAPGRWPSGPG